MAITKKDIEKLSNVFTTKKELQQEILSIKFDLEKFATKEEMNRRFDQVTKTLDWLVGAFQDFKQELSLQFARYKRHDDKLEDHERRVKVLETKALNV